MAQTAGDRHSYSKELSELEMLDGVDKQAAQELLAFSERNLPVFPQLSLKAANQALVILADMEDDTIRMKAHSDLADGHWKLKSVDQALINYFKALELSKQLDDANAQVHILKQLYYIYKYQGLGKRKAESIRSLEALLSTRLSAESKGHIFFTLNNYQWSIGHQDSSFMFRDSAEVYWDGLGDLNLTGMLLNDKALAVFSLGDTVNALKLLRRVIAISDISKAKPEAFHNLALIYTWQGALTKADSIAKLAIAYTMEMSKLDHRIGALYDRSLVRSEMGDFETALSLYQEMDVFEDSLYSINMSNAIAEAQTKYDLTRREAEISFQRSQRNFFIVLTFLFLAIATSAIVIYTNRIRSNKLLSEQRIAKLEKEKEVMGLQSMLFAQEEERQRIARDLHDSIGALLSAAKLHLSNIEAEVEKLANLDFLKSTGEIIDRASIEVRRVSHDMMPGVLMKLGLFEGLEDFFERLRKNSNLTISFTHDEFEQRLENKQEVMLYRMIQEMVNNTLKHAEASEIKLMIKRENSHLIVDYRDDGKGFDAAELDNQSNMGLTGLKSRAAFLNGKLTLNATPLAGVHYLIQIPV